MKKSNFKKGLAGLILVGASLFGGTKSDAGTMTLSGDFPVNSAHVVLGRDVSFKEGFDDGLDLIRESSTEPRVNMYSKLGDLKLSRDLRPEYSNTNFEVYIRGENLTNPVSGVLDSMIIYHLAEQVANCNLVGDLYGPNGNNIFSNVKLGKASFPLTIDNNETYRFVARDVPEPSVKLFLLNAAAFGLSQLRTSRKKE